MGREEAVDGGGEFAFSNADFARVRQLIHARAGIALADSKRQMVYGRLGRRLRALGLGSFRDYLDRLEAAPRDAEEWQSFTNALTTNLTAFFREAHHFEILARFLADRAGRGPQRIWCAAASTGEEPYSIAITACEALGTDAPAVEIVCSDVDTQVLETASRGVYPLDRVQGLDAPRLRRFFQRGTGPNEGWARVKPPLRGLVSFRPINLLHVDYGLRGPFDAIFCRNVMIYFDKPTQRAILERFRPLLAPDGLLFAGHSESFFHCADLFASCGRTVYRRTDGSGSAA
ncbi:MAG: chemotaxis protein CheR [Xanthomonadaceae bacterium]|jgi:chemotaxis protein methyltransferase CheR|nr:chemotaxis protein CheR [Xanthomonadaceae bacterium]